VTSPKKPDANFVKYRWLTMKFPARLRGAIVTTKAGQLLGYHHNIQDLKIAMTVFGSNAGPIGVTGCPRPLQLPIPPSCLPAVHQSFRALSVTQPLNYLPDVPALRQVLAVRNPGFG
jgi:hypothetical protein